MPEENFSVKTESDRSTPSSQDPDTCGVYSHRETGTEIKNKNKF